MAGHAAHCRLLIRELGIERAHVVAHSSSVAALQLALDAPRAVHTLTLMEPTRPAPPAVTQARFSQQTVQLAIRHYQAGDPAGAVDIFFRGVFGPGYRPALDRGLTGAFGQAVASAGAFLPALLQRRTFTKADARRTRQPALAVPGGASHPMSAERQQLLPRWLPGAEPPGLTRLLHAQDATAVAGGLAAFPARYPLPG
jgi:pimeloyl-ACP methyl ester carboxylesterase